MAAQRLYSMSTRSIQCSVCGCELTLPTRSASYDAHEECPDPRKFFHWSHQDEFGDEDFVIEHRKYSKGVTLVVTPDGIVQPLPMSWEQDGRSQLPVVPNFGPTIYWVCGACKDTRPEFVTDVPADPVALSY